jgi:uncharacterized protein
MPLPKPKAGESKSDFIGRCMEAQAGEDKPQDQKVAICNDLWENRGARAAEPRELDREEVLSRIDLAEEVSERGWFNDGALVDRVATLRTCWPAVRRFATGETDRLVSIYGGDDLVIGPPAARAVDEDAEPGAELPPKDRTLPFIASTEAVGRDFDIIRADAWKLKNYRSNPVFLWAHDYAERPIGRSLTVRNGDGVLRAKVLFTSEDENPRGMEILRLYKGGYLRAVSVGYIPIEFKFIESKDRPFGIDVTAADLLEISAVPVPANPEALLEARAAGLGVQAVDDWCGRALDDWQRTRAVVPLTRSAVETMRRQASGRVAYRSAAVPAAPRLVRAAPEDVAAELADVADLVTTAPGAAGYWCEPADADDWAVYRQREGEPRPVLLFDHLSRAMAHQVVLRKNTPKGPPPATAEAPHGGPGPAPAPIPAPSPADYARAVSQALGAQLGPAIQAEVRRLTGRLD